MKVVVRFLMCMIAPFPMLASAETKTPEFTRSGLESELTAEGARIDRFTLYSPSMKRDIKAVVVLPPAYMEERDSARYPILYTLHGRGAPYDTWAQMPRLRKQLANMPFIYTCFDGDAASYYIDAANPIPTGRKKENDPPTSSLFQTFFFEEFLPAVDGWYRVNPAARGVTGFSMGGSGAMTYMLRRPGLFCSVSGLSSAFLDQNQLDSPSMKALPDKIGSFEAFPERYEAIDHYLQIKHHLAAGTELPPIYQHIGSEDFLLEMNRRFKHFAESEGLDLTYLESAGGHNWTFWHPASVGVAEFHWAHFRKVMETASTPRP